LSHQESITFGKWLEWALITEPAPGLSWLSRKNGVRRNKARAHGTPQDRLKELAVILKPNLQGSASEAFPADARRIRSAPLKRFFAFQQEKGIEIDLLINNAVRVNCEFTALKNNAARIWQVNCNAVVHRTRCILPEWSPRPARAMCSFFVNRPLQPSYISTYCCHKALNLLLQKG